MHLLLTADADAYITNRVIDGQRATGSNVGAAGTLDLFKLYGATTSGSVPNVELSRLLVKFDIAPLQQLISSGRINQNHSSFSCTLKLKDVYGGQSTPSNFTVLCYPLSRSFDEGQGRDVAQYSDRDACNFISASRTTAWHLSGCALGAGAGTNCDYVTASTLGSLSGSMLFVTGEEDLEIDVTSAVRAILTGSIPNSGFRLSLAAEHELDQLSYFVKRFGARSAYDASKRPTIVVGYDDSIQDDTNLLVLDETLTLFLHNYSLGAPANLISGSTTLTGSNCLALKFVTEISGGWHGVAFTGSQHGSMTGVYSASVLIPSTNQHIAAHLEQTGSVKLQPVWGSLDGRVAFLSSSAVRLTRRAASNVYGPTKKYVVACSGLGSDVEKDREITVRVNLFDRDSTGQATTRLPIKDVGATVRDVHCSVRNVDTGERVFDFDTTLNTTRLSSDAMGMWFRLFTHGFVVGHRYVIDIMTRTNGVESIYADASPPFRIVSPR